MGIILFISLFAAAGFFDAIRDAIAHNFNATRFADMRPGFWRDYFNPAVSWRNKWRAGSYSEERFWGSSTVFVFITDAWHACKFFYSLSVCAGCFFATITLLGIFGWHGYALVLVIAAQKAITGAAFEITYRILKND